MNFKNKQFTTVLLALVSLCTVFTTLFFNNMSNKVSAITQESPFGASDISENLFTVDEYGDLLMSVIRKEDGTTTGPIAFCLNKQKLFPRNKVVQYQSILDDEWTWELASATFPNATQVEQIQRVLYASNYVFAYKLGDYGLEDDELSLYEATQIAEWAILEGWTPADVKKKDDVLADATMNALATKIHALFSDLYAYGVSNNASYKEGVSIHRSSDNAVISNYTIQEGDLNRPAFGRSYYRTPLLEALPNQEYGYLFQGDYAYSYNVGFNGTVPEGSRIVNKNGEPQTSFTTDPSGKLEFYVEIPADKVVGNTGSVSVVVTTSQFRRAAPILWRPVTETAYQTLLENYFIADSATQTLTVDYTGIGGVAQVVVEKLAEQIKGFQKIKTAFGDVYKPIYEMSQLAGSTYEIYIESANGEMVFLATDGEMYLDGDKLFPGYLTSTDEQTSFDVLPMATEFGQTGYKVIEKTTTPGYLPITAPEQSVVLTMNPAGLAVGTLLYEADRIKVDFGFTKMEEYFDSNNVKDYRTVEGIVFGVYTTAAIDNIPANTLIGLLTSDINGYVDGSILDLPINEKFVVKELSTKESLTLDATVYTLDTTVPAGYTDATITVELKNPAGNPVDEITNYLRSGNIAIHRDVEQFNPSLGKFNFEPVTGAGQVGLYSDSAATTLIKNVVDASGDLPDGTYYVKDAGIDAQHVTDDTIYEVVVKAGETQDVTVTNPLKTTSVNLAKTDVTNPTNIKPMANVTFNLTLSGVVIATETTNADGDAVFADVKVGYVYEFVEAVPVGYNIPAQNKTIDLTNADETSPIETVSVTNTKTNISGNIHVTVKDETTDLAVEGMKYSLYAKGDVGFTTPLGTITTDAQGAGDFLNLAASHYVLKEVQTFAKYAPTPLVAVDLSKILDGETVNVEILLKSVSVAVTVNNVDEYTGENLNGGKFGLYDVSNKNTPIVEFIITADGVGSIANVPAGNYIVKQTQAPVGYVLNDTEQSIEVNTTSPAVINVIVKNRPITALVRVIAVDAKTNERLKDAKFDVFYDNDAALVNKLLSIATNNNGQADIPNTRIGIYKLVEVAAPVGYNQQPKDIQVNLSSIKDGDIVTITVKYSKNGENELPTIEVERPYTGVFDDGYLFIVLSCLMILLGLGVGALSFLKITDK